MSFNLTEKFLEFALIGAEWVMWLLVAASVVSVYVMVERVLFYNGVARADAELRRRLLAALAQDDLSSATKLSQSGIGVGASLVAEMLAVANRGTAAIEATLNAARNEQRMRLTKNLSYLGTLGSNAPFIGLFGTVLGIIQAFHELAKPGANAGAGASQEVMKGISEALVATAVGLMVAIPAVIAYNVFQGRVKRTLAQADGLASAAFALIIGKVGEASSAADKKEL